MIVVLYVNLSERNKLNKTLQAGPTLTGSLREGSSIIDPVILVEGEDMSGYNYAYIPLFQRYYFIGDIVSDRTGIWELTMHSDPLMSFRSQLLGCSVILDSSTVAGADNYLSGGQWVARQKDLTDIVTFPGGLSANGEFILITAGG